MPKYRYTGSGIMSVHGKNGSYTFSFPDKVELEVDDDLGGISGIELVGTGTEKTRVRKTRGE